MLPHVASAPYVSNITLLVYVALGSYLRLKGTMLLLRSFVIIVYQIVLVTEYCAKMCCILLQLTSCNFYHFLVLCCLHQRIVMMGVCTGVHLLFTKWCYNQYLHSDSYISVV